VNSEPRLGQASVVWALLVIAVSFSVASLLAGAWWWLLGIGILVTGLIFWVSDPLVRWLECRRGQSPGDWRQLELVVLPLVGAILWYGLSLMANTGVQAQWLYLLPGSAWLLLATICKVMLMKVIY